MLVRYARVEDIPAFSKLIKEDIERQPSCFKYDFTQAITDAENILQEPSAFGLVAYELDEDKKECPHGLWLGRILRLPGATKTAIMDIITVTDQREAWQVIRDMLSVLAQLHGCGGAIVSISGRDEETVRRWFRKENLQPFGYMAIMPPGGVN